MILVDSSVWIDHLRREDAKLRALLLRRQVSCHPFIVGELALGSLRKRTDIIRFLSDLPVSAVATGPEMLDFIDRHGLHGLGIGYVDAHLLGATCLTPGAQLWTRDRRLREAARQLKICAELDE